MAVLEAAAMAIAAAAILLLGGVVTASVIGRELFNAGVPDDIVIAGLLMIPLVMLPLAHIHAKGGHIAVTVTSDWLPPRGRAALSVLGDLLGLLFFGAIGWFLARKIPRDFAGGAYYDGELGIPVWPMKVVFALAVALFLLRLSIELWRHLRFALRGI
jgi:TRAP-type C4-dicarboxylate transport system permease small subunit